jgi:phospholipid transport system substrate-binding protein
MKLTIKSIFFGILMLFSLAAFAQDPVSMLQTTSDQMLAAVKQSSNRDSATLYGIIQRILLPHIDLDVMSRLVVGKYWKTATPAQKTEFKQQFTRFVSNTYSTALAAYKDEKIKFYPVRGGVKGNRVQVNSDIFQNNGQTINVAYQLTNLSGDWKVYDFSVDGISMVQNYRSQFADVLAQSGFDGLLKRLQAHNARS